MSQIAELEAINVPPTERPDFSAFWAETIQRCETVPLNVNGSTDTEVRDLTFEGLDGTSVHT